MEDITKHRQAIAENIAKAFGENIEKAHKEGDIHPNGKWYWNSSVNGGKGDWRVIRNKKGTSTTSGGSGSAGASGGSDSRVSAFMSALKVVNSKFTDESKIKVVKTDKGNWDTTYDGHRIGVIRGSFLSEKVAKEKGWLEEDDKDTKKSSNTVTHDINGTKVTVTKNSDGSYTLEANGKKVKSDDPSYYVFGTNIKPRIKRALAQEVGLETKKTTDNKKSEKSSYESKEADAYDKGDGKIGNYKVPTHTSYPAANLYYRLKNNRHFGFKYGLPSDEIMEKLKDYKGNVKISYHDNAGTSEIYRIKFL